MNKKTISLALASILISVTLTTTAFAAMPNGTVVIGSKAFGLVYANAPANASEITNAIVEGGAIYVKNFEGNWINNSTGLTVAKSVIPAVIYKNGTEKINFDTSDVDASSVITIPVDNTVTPVDTTDKIKEAKQAVVKAETSRLQTDVDAANTLVNNLTADVAPNTIRADLLIRLKNVLVLDVTSPDINSVSLTIGKSVSATKAFSGDYKISLAGMGDTDMFTGISLKASEKATVKTYFEGVSRTVTTNASGEATILVADLLGSLDPQRDGISVKTLKSILSLTNGIGTVVITLKDVAGNEKTIIITITAN